MKRPLFAALLAIIAVVGVVGGGLFVPTAHAASIMNTLGLNVMTPIMDLFGFLVGMAALTLDYAVYYTVLNMGNWVHHLTAIGATWTVLRDIGNIMLIFGFIAAGLATILGVELYGWSKKMLPMLIVAAVLINFSLFFTEAVIDVGNLFATQLYSEINGGQASALPTLNGSFFGNAGTAISAMHTEGISNEIMSQLGLQTIYGNPAQDSSLLLQSHPWFIGFLGILLFLMAAFVMFSLAFILIGRFVALIFLLVVAPIGVAGWAVPGLRARAKAWWTALAEQTIVAPITLLMLYIALRVILAQQFLMGFNVSGPGAGAAATAFAAKNPDLTAFGGYLLSFLVAMGLLFAVVIFAKRWSAFGADFATKTAGKMSFGLAAWGANRTIGRTAHYAARGLVRTNVGNYLDAATGRAMSKALRKTAASTFDFRNSGLMSSLPTDTKIDAGKAAKDGFEGALSRNIKSQQDALKWVGEAREEAGTLRRERKEIERTDAAHTAAEKRHEEAKEELSKQTERAKELKALHQEQDKQGNTKAADALLRELDKTNAQVDRSQRILDAAAESLTKTKAAKEEAAKAPAARIKANKESFVEGMHSSWIPLIHGPGKNQAVRKLRKSLEDKSTEKKALEEIKKLVEEEKKTEGEAEEKTKGEKA